MMPRHVCPPATLSGLCDAMQTEMILPMGSADDLGVWERLDDVIMGGQSDSALTAAENGGELCGDLPAFLMYCLGTITARSDADAKWPACTGRHSPSMPCCATLPI